MGACSGNKPWLYCSIFGFVLLIVGLILTFAAIPAIIKDQIAKQVRLERGTEQFDRFEELPIDIKFKVYMFDVVNPEEVTRNGAKPEVEQKGPYVYSLTHKKEDITYFEDEDSYSYFQYQHYEFDAVASGAATENDTITMLNVPLNSIFQLVEPLGELLLDILVENFWPNMFPDTTTMFHEVRVGDVLFDGHRFCVQEDMYDIDRLYCIAMGLIGLQNIIPEPDFSSLTFSFFKYKQDAHDGAYNVYAGIKEVTDLGFIRHWDGYAYTDIWDERMSKCNKVGGRDSTIYPPYIEKEDSFDIFTTDICRTCNIHYVAEDEFKDIAAQKRILRPDTFASGETLPENACFCSTSTKDITGAKACLPDGFMDLAPCLSSPIIASFPHFMHADEDYSDTIVGLEPIVDDHTTFVLVEPNTGTPLRGAKRIQFNMILRPIPGISVTSNLANSMVPIMWVEEAVEMTDELADLLKDSYLNLVKVVDAVKWAIVALGGIIFVGCGCLYWYRRKN